MDAFFEFLELDRFPCWISLMTPTLMCFISNGGAWKLKNSWVGKIGAVCKLCLCREASWRSLIGKFLKILRLTRQIKSRQSKFWLFEDGLFWNRIEDTKEDSFCLHESKIYTCQLSNDIMIGTGGYIQQCLIMIQNNLVVHKLLEDRINASSGLGRGKRKGSDMFNRYLNLNLLRCAFSASRWTN